jgi:hypothetical protein
MTPVDVEMTHRTLQALIEMHRVIKMLYRDCHMPGDLDTAHTPHLDCFSEILLNLMGYVSGAALNVVLSTDPRIKEIDYRRASTIAAAPRVVISGEYACFAIPDDVDALDSGELNMHDYTRSEANGPRMHFHYCDADGAFLDFNPPLTKGDAR